MKTTELIVRRRYLLSTGSTHQIVAIFGAGKNVKVQLDPPLDSEDRKGAWRQYKFFKITRFAELVVREVA